jgi:hypothetical protein
MENSEKKDIIKSSLSDPIRELFTDIADMGLNEVIEKLIKNHELLKDIPVIKWLFVANDVRNIIQSAFFLQKYANFIGSINETMKDDLLNDGRLNKIFSDRKLFSNIIDQIIISLDRYQTINKSKMLGILFKETFKNNNFSIKEYNILIFSIENIHPSVGVECLKSFYDYKCEIDKAENKEMKEEIWARNSSLNYSPLATTCLLRLPEGGTYFDNFGGAYINELGYKFYELVVSKIKE